MPVSKNSTYESRKVDRPDKFGPMRNQFLSNKRKILATQDRCGICGQPVDKNLKFPDPMSPTIDHIIPVAKGGHPCDIANLQLSHMKCNRDKSDKVVTKDSILTGFEMCKNDNLPLSFTWKD